MMWLHAGRETALKLLVETSRDVAGDRRDGCLLRRDATQNAELVVFRISQHDPTLPALTDVDSPGAEIDQPLDLLVLAHVDRHDVKMEPILRDLVLRDPDDGPAPTMVTSVCFMRTCPGRRCCRT